MLRIDGLQFMWPTRHQVADIVHLTGEDLIPGGRSVTVRTRARFIIPMLFDNLGRRQVFWPRERDVRPVFARPQFGG